MKAIRALFLVLTLSVCAYAGNMDNGRAGNMDNGKTGNIPCGKAGWMDNGKTGDMPNDFITATALQLLQSVLPLF